jgi:hypothetical protein
VLPSANDKTFSDIAEEKTAIAGLEARIAATKRLAESIKEVIAAIEKQTKTENDYTTKLVTGGRQLYLNSNPAEAPAQWSAQQSWMLGGFRRGTGDLTGEEFAKSYFDDQYHTGQRELKDTRDSEKRGLSLYGAQASLGGVSELDQINTTAALRKMYADQEYDALRKMADAKNDEDAKEAAIDQQHQKYLDAEIERQQALLQLALRQKEQFESLAVGFVDAARSGGISKFMTGQLNKIEDTAVSHLAGMAWGDPTKGAGLSSVMAKALPKGGALDKLFGISSGVGDPASLKLQGAGDHLFGAADALLAAARELASSRSGGSGGGGFSSAGSTFSRLGSTGSGEGDGAETWGLPTEGSPGDWGGEYGGFASPSSPTDEEIANAGIRPEDMASLQNVPGGGGDYQSGAGTPSGGGMTVGKGLGYAGAAATAAYGAYSGFKAGGAQGALAGTGAILGAASLIPGPQQPFVMAAAMATTLIASLLGDPKQNRAKDLATQAQERSYTMPTGADYSLDAGGGYTDYNYTGRNRAVNVTNNVYAMDSTTFQDFLIANPNALSAGLTSAIQGGNADDVVGSLSARSN